MRVKLLTLSFTPSLGAIDERPLSDFVRDKEVIAVREHFFIVHELPYLACLVTYQDAPLRTQPPVRPQESSEQDPLARLEGSERALFATLREWRNSQAKKDGVPAYVLFTNAELARIAHLRPDSLNALGALPGIGPGKVRRYGAAILAQLHGEGARTTASAETEPSDLLGSVTNQAVPAEGQA